MITEAKSFVGQYVQVLFRDRSGREISEMAEIFDVAFIPLYGACLITDIGEIRLDRIIRCDLEDYRQAA